jgi:SulP family sulfate permease
VVSFDMLVGVAVAVGLSVFSLLARVSHPHDGVLGIVPDLAGMHDVADFPTARQVPGLLVYRYDAPLFFGNAEDFRHRALRSVREQEERGQPVRWFLLNAEANVEVDITGLDALEQVRQTLDRRGIVMALSRVKQDLLVELEKVGLVDRIGLDRIYATLPTALSGYDEWVAEQARESP